MQRTSFDKVIAGILIIVLLVSTTTYLYAQNDDVVAQAGNIKITKEEFRKRFEFTPHPGTVGDIDSTKAKKDFLQTLIAEKLLAEEAIKDGYESLPEYQKAFDYTRNFYLRDALYTIEVKNKTVMPDSDLVLGRRRMLRTISMKFIFSRDEKEITDIYRALMTTASFDSILATRPESAEQKNAKEITFGSMNEKIEDYLYKLKPAEVTPPIELEEGWYICKVYSETIKNELHDIDLQKIERVVKDRLEEQNYQTFFKKFFKGVVVDADQHIFHEIWDWLYAYIHENSKMLVSKRGIYTLVEKDLNTIRGKIKDEELKKVFIKFKKNPVTLNGFFDFMCNEGFEFLRMDSVHVGSRLNTFISTYIQNEILAREALQRGYDKLPDVKSDLEIWREYFLSTMVMKGIYKKEKVSDEEALKFYNKSNKAVPRPAEFKISEITVNNLDVVKEIFSELDKGKDFKELASEYNSNDSLKNSGGELSSDRLEKNSAVWDAASRMKVGEVYGPIKVPGGFSVIKLLAKQEPKREQAETFEEAKNDIKDILETRKMNNELIDHTARLAMDNKLEINDKVLNSIKVHMINMIVFRRFGFGGQQLAVPYIPNFSEWYKKYLELRESLSF